MKAIAFGVLAVVSWMANILVGCVVIMFCIGALALGIEKVKVSMDDAQARAFGRARTVQGQ